MTVPRAVCHATGDGDWVPGPGPGGAVRLWPYTQSRRRLRQVRDARLADPVNAFVLGAAPARVLADLAEAGWATPADGATHVVWLDGRRRVMSGHTALGDRERRVHVRVWDAAGGTLAAAHDERADERGRHRVLSWDAARAVLLEALTGRGYAAVAPSAPVAAPELRGVPGDGRIWRLVAP